MAGPWWVGRQPFRQSQRDKSHIDHRGLGDEQKGCGLCVRHGGKPLLSRKVTCSDL